MVFYDQNANGILDNDEPISIPSVSVSLGARTGVSERGGRVVVNDVPVGSQQAEVGEESLPPYFASSGWPTVEVPQPAGTQAMLPLTLSIGRNRTNLYMAFGDSITSGIGSSSEEGYLPIVDDLITDHWGLAESANEGIPGTRSDQGAARISESLVRVRPAYTLILYGTNDWNRPECKDERFPCFTIDSLRNMIRFVRGNQSLPIVGTIPPVNPTFVDRGATERNDWVERMNELIRPMVAEEGAVLADVHAAFLEAGPLEELFVDHVHPNDEGYEIIARSFFETITGARGSASTFRGASPGLAAATSSHVAPSPQPAAPAAPRLLLREHEPVREDRF